MNDKMEDQSYFLSLEEKIKSNLLQKARLFGSAPTSSLVVEELDEKWNEFAPEFMQYAVREFNDYPTATLAWASYLGMALANIWDSEPVRLADTGLFATIVSMRGWDEMDEYISQMILGFAPSGDKESELSKLLLSLAQEANSLLRREAVEAGTSSAFYALASTLKAMFALGVSLELHRLGYKYEKVEVSLPTIS